MSIDKVSIQAKPSVEVPRKTMPLITPEDIKAILYLGLHGEISLPDPKRQVDIFA
ncbi:MAG TPA: hypothetical protein PLG43_03625 [Spirochaetia bacterium]|jgi:hypothetical protein|nr:hypothetical protein [Spirochaetia bacterium]